MIRDILIRHRRTVPFEGTRLMIVHLLRRGIILRRRDITLVYGQNLLLLLRRSNNSGGEGCYFWDDLTIFIADSGVRDGSVGSILTQLIFHSDCSN
jgi:hypothetical protein